MLNIELNRELAIAILEPHGELSEKDFDVIASVIDPYIKQHGRLNGLIISTKDFPGWESFGAMLRHFKFVKNHEKELTHVALVTDSAIGGLAEKIAKHFVSASIKHFPFNEYVQAENWILGKG